VGGGLRSAFFVDTGGTSRLLSRKTCGLLDCRQSGSGAGKPRLATKGSGVLGRGRVGVRVPAKGSWGRMRVERPGCSAKKPVDFWTVIKEGFRSRKVRSDCEGFRSPRGRGHVGVPAGWVRARRTAVGGFVGDVQKSTENEFVLWPLQEGEIGHFGSETRRTRDHRETC
jgi:hypothetical protein